MRASSEQEEHVVEKVKSATRGDLADDLGDGLEDDSEDELEEVWFVAVGPLSTRPRAIAISAGSIIMTSMTTVSKQITIFFISILLVGLTAYYLCHITFVTYIVADEEKIPHSFGTFGGIFEDSPIK
jgi:hypothetical protein